MTTITVAIPTYNKEQTITRCLKSILPEKNSIDSVILVDNQSTDKTYTIAKTYAPFVQCYQNKTNLGMAQNWNECIKHCTTEWLMILHADDELVPGAIRFYREFIEKYPSVGIIHADSYSAQEENPTAKAYTQKKQKEFWPAGLEGMRCNYGVCSAVLVKMDAYKRLGNFIESLSSDAEMWSRIASTYDVGFIDKPTVTYYNSKSSTGFEAITKRSVFAIKRDWDFLYKTIESHYPTNETRSVYRKHVRQGMPGSYYAIAKANIKVKNYLKALQILAIIIIYYNGFIPLLRYIYKDLKKVYRVIF